MADSNYGNLYWRVFSGCNLNCSMCLREHNTKKVKGYESKLLKQAKSLGFSTIVFTGGEPTLREDLLELSHMTHANRLNVRIDTNGINLTRKFLFSVKNYLYLLGLPLHGSNSELHDSIVGMNGHFDIVADRAEMARDLEIPLKITTAVTRENIGDIENIAKYLSRVINPNIYGINGVVKRSLNSELFEKMKISEGEFDEMRKKLIGQDYPFKLSFCSGHKESDRAYIFVNPDFTVTIPAGDSEENIGDLKSEDLESIMKRAKLNQELHLERSRATSL